MSIIGTLGGAVPANSYSGKMWEAQRIVSAMTLGQRAASIFRVGTKPVVLKARVFGYTGDGLTVNVYRSPVYTDGTPETTIFNMNDGSTEVLLSSILVGATITADGTPCATTMSLIGPASAQGAGSTLSRFGGNRILLPNTDYLLTFISLSNAQTVTARLEFFEGFLNYATLE